MGEVIDMKDYISVKFFKDEVQCGFCEQATNGRVYDKSEQVVCTVCGGPMLELSSEDFFGSATIIFHPED